MNVPADWWQTFFRGVSVEMWLRAPTEAQNRAEADFLEKSLRPPAGGKLLDVPCGGGRHALELAARGYQMTGVDLSDDFLRHARAEGQRRGITVDWQQRDMRDLPWQDAFDGAYCFGNSFGYLDDAGNADFFRAVARTLKPGARFVLETGTAAESLLPNMHERRWFEVGDILFLIHNHYDHLGGALETECMFIRDGKTEKGAFRHRVYTYRQLVGLLEAAGFTGAQGQGGLSGEPYVLGLPRLYLVATRAGGC